MEKTLREQCLVCKADLRGEMIPNTDPPQYYTKLMGVEYPHIYDGTLFWECPNCESRFQRFAKDNPLWALAEPYVRSLAQRSQEPIVPGPRMPKERVQITDDMYLVNVHNESLCSGEFCSIHNPSEHPMKDMPKSFEASIVLRVCPHGVSHPDPDALAWYQRTFGQAAAAPRAAHECCAQSCCGAVG